MDTLHFERYEYKYVVPTDLVNRIRNAFLPYVNPDPNAAGKHLGRYTIYNIYLDTPNFDFYQAAEGGAADRFKLRIRWYDSAAQGPFFFEVKRKIRRVIVKDRVRISGRQFKTISTQGVHALESAELRSRLLPFVNRATNCGALPVVLCRYTREPYESVFGEYARVTIDRAMCFQEAHGYSVPGNERSWSYVDSLDTTQQIPRSVILELKFANEFPRWMSDLVSEYQLERVGYSKYGSSISRCLDDRSQLRSCSAFSSIGESM